jgi:hypothetical protein
MTSSTMPLMCTPADWSPAKNLFQIEALQKICVDSYNFISCFLNLNIVWIEHWSYGCCFHINRTFELMRTIESQKNLHFKELMMSSTMSLMCTPASVPSWENLSNRLEEVNISRKHDKDLEIFSVWHMSIVKHSSMSEFIFLKISATILQSGLL